MQGDAQLYHELIMERTRNPRFAGRPAAFEAQGTGDNPFCGDHVEVFITAGADVCHHAQGCAILVASADLMAQAVAGASRDEIVALDKAFSAMVNSGTPDPSLGDLNALAGVHEYRSRIRCATLPWAALSGALENMQNG